MLALLHTSGVHVATFDRLARELGNAAPIRHEVREDLLSDTLAAGAITDAVRASTAEAVRALALGGAKVVVCTCSTLGAVAEATPVPELVHVLRVDRPMAEQAVASGRRIVVVAALRSTLDPTMNLLRQIATDANRAISVTELLCEHAWPSFESGNRARYIDDIVTAVESTAQPTDVILLAQASMEPAEERLAHLGIPVLSSPRSGLLAALAIQRAFDH